MDNTKLLNKDCHYNDLQINNRVIIVTKAGNSLVNYYSGILIDNKNAFLKVEIGEGYIKNIRKDLIITCANLTHSPK